MTLWVRLMVAQCVIAALLLASAAWYTAALTAYGRCAQ